MSRKILIVSVILFIAAVCAWSASAQDASDPPDAGSTADEADASSNSVQDLDATTEALGVADEGVDDDPDVVDSSNDATSGEGEGEGEGEGDHAISVNNAGACLCPCACTDEGAKTPRNVSIKSMNQALGNAMTNQIVPQNIVHALTCDELDELKHTIWARHGYYFEVEDMRAGFMKRYGSIVPNPSITAATINMYLTAADASTIWYIAIARRSCK